MIPRLHPLTRIAVTLERQRYATFSYSTLSKRSCSLRYATKQRGHSMSGFKMSGFKKRSNNLPDRIAFTILVIMSCFIPFYVMSGSLDDSAGYSLKDADPSLKKKADDSFKEDPGEKD